MKRGTCLKSCGILVFLLSTKFSYSKKGKMRTQFLLLCIVASCLNVYSSVLATDRLVSIIGADTNYECPISWWKFNEGIGSTAYDSVGGNPGIIHGATWTTDYTGIALDFDGDDYVEVSDDSSLRFTQYDSFSICSWAKPVEGFIVCKMRASAQEGYFGYNIVHTSSNRYYFTAEESMHGSVSVYTGETPQGDWSHVTAVYDNKDMKIYLDGELEGTGTFTYDTGSTAPDKDLAIGARSVDSLIDNHFIGIIDDVRIYNRALSIEEVRQVYGGADPNCPLVIWISATEFNFFADEGGPNPESQVLRIRRMGLGILNWEVTADCNWINAEPNSGSSMGEANEVMLTVDISGLAPGSHNCDLMISDQNAYNSPQIVRIHLGIYGSEIELSADQFIFAVHESDVNPDEQKLTIRNSAGGILNWSITSDCDWLQVEPITGSSMGEPNEVTLSVDISGIGFGIYDCNVAISDHNAVNSPQTVRVKLVVFGDDLLDFGDCPDPHYPTLLVNNGALHIIDPNVFLGSGIDGESDGQPTLWADGDDINDIPDEDGVSFTSVLFDDCTRDVNVVASCDGKLDAWFDFNADGDWSDPGEQIFASEPLNTGSNILTFSIPSDAAKGDTYARFRFSTVGGLDPNGPAPDGEVEDYMVSILWDCRPYTFYIWPPPPDWFGYEDWVEWNKPECWCYPKQCYGDINGTSFFGKPVTLSDLTVMKAVFNKTNEQLRLVPNGICADLNHATFFGKRVTVADLGTFRQYFNQPESQVPDCFGYEYPD